VTFQNIAARTRRTELDRETWAGETLLIISYDTTGVGEIETELLDFGVVFESPPFFSYGVELQPGETLVSGSFPAVYCGVKEFQKTDADNDDRAIDLYIGAFLWISIDTSVSYKLRFRLSFEGTAFRNVEYFRGSNG